VQHAFGFVHALRTTSMSVMAAFNQRDFVADFREVLFLAGREVVQTPRTVPAADEFVHRIRPDEPAPPVNEAHPGNLLQGPQQKRGCRGKQGALRKDERLAFLIISEFAEPRLFDVRFARKNVLYDGSRRG